MVDIGTVIKMQHPEAIPGVDFSFDDEDGDGNLEIILWNETLLGPRPASYEALQAWADGQAVPVAKQRKQKELEAAFQNVWDTQYGTQIAVGLVLYFEFKSDPRTVAVTAARTNFINKTNALNDLGRNGRPPLTLENIAAIVW